MTIKNIVIRKKLEGIATEILYPVTSIENVTGLSSLLTTINTNLAGKSDTGHKHEWSDINTGKDKPIRIDNFKNSALHRTVSLGTGNNLKAYNNWTADEKNGGHRIWTIRFPTNNGNTSPKFWGKIKISFISSYSSFNASGLISKEINISFNGGALYNNVGRYVDLSGNIENDFRISELILNTSLNCWEIKIYSEKASGNNTPKDVTIEGWFTAASHENTLKGIEFITTPEISKDTTYTATLATVTNITSNGVTLGTKVVNWSDTPRFETPYGREIATVQDMLDLESNKVDKVAGKQLSTNDLTDTLKDYYDTAYTHSQIIGSNPHQTTYEQVLNRPSFAAVATSGEYEDLEGKPDLALKLDKNFSALPTQTNALLTDVLVLNRGSIAQKVTLANLLAHVNNEIFEVVDVLPTLGDVNKIYLVPSSKPETQNELDEFIWVDGAWERIGGVTVDLNNYYNKTDVNSLLSNKVDKNIAITPNTFPKITYDAKGLVTGGGKLAATDIPSLAASKINSGTFDEDRIPNLPATKISSGIFTVDRIPSLDADKISSGVFSYARIPNLLADKIVAGTFHIDRIPYLTEEKIPNLHANRITAGEFSPSLIPELEISKIYGLQDSLDTLEENKQDKLVPGYNITIDEDNVISAGTPDSTSYFNYASSIYGDKYNLLAYAWMHSLTVDQLEIGTAQYPMGDTYGIIIPQGVTTIGAIAFKDWTENNQPLVIPNSVTSIGNSAFSHWVLNNQPLVIPSSVATIERLAFYQWRVNNQPLTIQKGVTTIGSSAFNSWTSNNQPLIIPNSVTSIGSSAFQDWTSNNQPLIIPNSVTTIGEFAFIRWESNTHPIIIPNSVTSIGSGAFQSWELVPYIEIQATTPPTLAHYGAFSNQNNAPIYVPDESVDDYKEATQWLALADRIFPISDKPEVMDAIEAAEQQIEDLHENKLNKIWTDITEQTTTNLTDILVFNRGSNVYKAKLGTLLAHVDNKIFEVVNQLPTTGEVNKIYLVPSSDPKTQNVLDEFMWVDSDWERIGAVSVDLSNYYNKTAVDSMLDNKVDKVADKDLSTNDYTNTDKQSVEKIPAIEQAILDLESDVISAEVDLNEMSYFDYASSIYGDKYSLLENAWEHSFTVDPSKISEDSPLESPRGTAQYPNGETEGVIIPDGVTTIGEDAFYNWTLNNQPLVIPSSVTSIGQSAFNGWTSNNQPLTIPNSVTSIGNIAFGNWSENNQPLTIPNSVTSIGNIAFSSWSANNHPLTISNSVTSISNGAFGYWESNNQPLVIPDSVTNIETGAFQYWISNNQPLVIPDSVTSIGNYAFRYWSSNTHPLVIPSSVTSIGQYAFENWSSVPYIEIHATTPPTLVNADAFYYQNNAPIYVPDESIDDYKEATNWDMLEYRIFPMSNKPDLRYLNENKLNKVWTDIVEQPTITLTDNLIFNRDSNVYKTTVAKLLAEVDNKIFEIASVLPTTGVTHKIYLVPSSDPKTQNVLDEFIWVGSAWERIGSVSMDLSNYYNKTDVDSMLDVKVDKVSGKGLSTNDFTDEYKNKLDNVIDDVSQLQTGKQDKLVAGNNITINPTTNVISASGGSGGSGEVDLNTMAYFNYASSIYGDKYSLLENAWEHSLTVDPLEISADSSWMDQRGTAQYPNGETEGVIIPQGVTSIGKYAFYLWPSSNHPLVIPNSVTSIGQYAFYGWSANNKPLMIPDSVTSIGESAFSSWYSNEHLLVIPNSVTSIGDSAFTSWWSNNHPLIIPNSVTSISDYTFSYWESNNQPLVIPDSVTSIGKSAFYRWEANNKPLVIPDSVTSIGEFAFCRWELVPYVEILATTPPTLAHVNAFLEQNDAPIYVPDASVEAYKTATNWVDLADRIFPISDRAGVIGDIKSALDAILGV